MIDKYSEREGTHVEKIKCKKECNERINEKKVKKK